MSDDTMPGDEIIQEYCARADAAHLDAIAGVLVTTTPMDLRNARIIAREYLSRGCPMLLDLAMLVSR